MIIRFGDHVLDTERCELRRGGEPVAIEPKAFGLLAYLAARRERVVPREELVAALWPQEHVTPSSLTFCVNGARRAVGDDGTRQAVIRNRRGHGYRFVAACETESAAPAAAAPAPQRFVGRQRELGALRAAFEAAVRGQGGMVLLAGDAGIGKTRTVEELAMQARAAGAHVLVGRCYEGQESPAFWPWLQMIRAGLSAWRPAQLRVLLGAGAADIARMVPAVHNVLPEVPARPPDDVVQSRFRLFDSLAGYFKAVARWQPLLIVVDDLHWADRSSHTLLRFLVEELRGERALLVGTYRDGEVDRQHPFAGVVQALQREGAERLRLEGLSAREVHALLRAQSDAPFAAGLADQLARETEGNPLFVIELARHVSRGDRPAWASGQPLPETVETLIARRLQGLSEGARETLALAAVLGREFSVHLLEQLAPHGLAPVRGLIEAQRARVVEELPEVADRYRFAHALFRESLYAQLPALARARLHARVVAVLATSGAPHAAADAAEHALAALPELPLATAVAAAERAAQEALVMLAYEQAVRFTQRALAALDRHAPDDAASRCRLLLRLGEALSRLGDGAASRATFDDAAALARRHGMREELALAALRGSGGMVQPVILMQGQVAQLEEALARLGEGHAVLRSRLLSRLALALYYHAEGHRPRRRAMSDEATRLARRGGDDEALYWALVSRHWALWGPRAAARRLRIADELVRLGARLGQRALVVRAHTYRVGALLELGRVAPLDDAIATCEALATALRIPMFQWTVAYFHAMRALLRGDLADAQRLAGEAAAQGNGAGEDSAAHVFGIQVCALAFLEGRLPVLEALLHAYREQRPDMPFLDCTLTAMYAESGRADEARRLLRFLAAGRFRRIPQDNLWITGITLLALVAARLGATREAATLYRLLAPYDGLLVTCGNAVATVGPVAHYLGILARALGREADASRHAAAAARLNASIGAARWPGL